MQPEAQSDHGRQTTNALQLITMSALGFTNVETKALGAPSAVDKFGGNAIESLFHLEGLLTSMDETR